SVATQKCARCAPNDHVHPGMNIWKILEVWFSARLIEVWSVTYVEKA
ncbi:13401_t:CDS:1, partial [Ambispora leptoticha]